MNKIWYNECMTFERYEWITKTNECENYCLFKWNIFELVYDFYAERTIVCLLVQRYV